MWTRLLGSTNSEFRVAVRLHFFTLSRPHQWLRGFSVPLLRGRLSFPDPHLEAQLSSIKKKTPNPSQPLTPLQPYSLYPFPPKRGSDSSKIALQIQFPMCSFSSLVSLHLHICETKEKATCSLYLTYDSGTGVGLPL